MTEIVEVSEPSSLPPAPRVSVYMLAYRHEKFIAQAIEGVVAQRCPFPIELLIGEDCSPDRTRAIALYYQRRHPDLIRVLTSEHNVGARANATRCIRACRGDYIAICEGDDYWHRPDKLKMQVELMDSDDSMQVCHTDFDRLTRFRHSVARHRNNPSPYLAVGSAYESLLHEWTVMSATAMFRRQFMLDFIDHPLNDPSLPFGDLGRLLYASLQGPVGYIDVSTATFRKMRGSAGNRGSKVHLQFQLAAEKCVESFMAAYPVGHDIHRSVKARIKKRIYDAAFFAERADLFIECGNWLRQNGSGPGLVLHQLRLLAISSRVPVRLLRALKDFINLRLSAFPS